MIQTAIWIPPSLCGCQLKMTADFIDGSVEDGISYRHPKPFTIGDIQIITVCDAHQPQTLTMPDTGIHMETDKYTGQPFQQRGYLIHPIANPSPAECLYEFLSRYGGQTHGYSCGCRTHQFIDENKTITYLNHPRHHKRCYRHQDDDLGMPRAASDHEAAQAQTVAG